MNRNATAIILIVLAAGIYFTVTKDIIVEIKEVKAVNDQYTTAIENAEQLIKVREQVLRAYNNLSEVDRERLAKMVPGTVDNIRLVIDMNSIGVRHGLALKNIAASAPSTATNRPSSAAQTASQPSTRTAQRMPEGTIPTPTLDSVTVSFDVSAPYLEFISFLQDLEANLRLMDLTKLNISVGEGNQYDFKVELKTYWLKQQ